MIFMFVTLPLMGTLAICATHIVIALNQIRDELKRLK